LSTDWSLFGFTYKSNDSSTVLKEYIEQIANKRMLAYKRRIHTGGKTGQSLWSHVMNLVTTIEQLRPLFHLNGNEMRCLLLALTVHDINKLPAYGKRENGWDAKYANAASITNLEEELTALEVERFFPEWKSYLNDIKYLADAHQVKSPQESSSNQVHVEQCMLDPDRLEGPLNRLMKVADVADNSHSGEYLKQDEKHIRDKLSDHMNAALSAMGDPRRYRFVGHRLAELRGLMTNVIHNVLVSFMRETYGREACIDLLYHPEGVDYLLDKRVSFQWSSQIQHRLAEEVGQQFAQMQANQLSQFIKAKPSGITVDDAAMESGSPIDAIFTCITNTVVRKQYKAEWREQRNAFVRDDLEAFLNGQDENTELREQVSAVLKERELVPLDEDALKRGEFAMAYRNFLKDHRDEELKAIKQDAWSRIYRLVQLPETDYSLYQLIDPYRRAYFLARAIPEQELSDMMEAALADLEQLTEQAQAAQATRKVKSKPTASSPQEEQETVNAGMGHVPAQTFDVTFLVDYLERNLQVWDSLPTVPVQAQTINFRDSLRRYADSKRPDRQCCYCSSSLPAEEWMAIQVPSSLGVQSFSNRLDGGSLRDPKRNVCAVCRTQFILEKLAWESHRDKQGGELVTFYLHFFPYSFFTPPFLHAWWLSIKNIRDTQNYRALFLNTSDYLLQWHDHPKYFDNWQRDYGQFQEKVRYTSRGLEGLGIPAYSETISNTPVLPLIVSGNNYGLKFLLALEKTVVLARWFDCRILLSRLPTPLLNLANEKLGDDPIALLIENVPSSMSWLLPQNIFTRKDLKWLCTKLGTLHAIARELATDGDQLLLVYDLVSAAAHDPLTLYHEVDLLIEQKATQRKGGKTENQAIHMTSVVAPLLKSLLQEGETV
jgi:CRISPR-associated protein Csc3